MEPRVVISGYYGFGNAGDEAVLAGIARSFESVCPCAHLTVQSIDPQATRDLHGLDAVNRYHLSDVLSSIWHCDLLVSGGGSLLQDVTSGRSMVYYLGIIALARMLRKKVMIYSQGIGPINSPALRRMTRIILNRVDLITVRDEQSIRTLLDLGVRKPRMLVTADASFAVESAQPDKVASIMEAAGAPAGSEVLGVAIRPWEGQEKWLPEVVNGLKKAESELGLVPAFLPMQESMDLGISLSAAESASSSPVVIANQLGPEQAKGVAASVKILVGMRLHALIFAASAGVPFVALSYDPKVTEFARIAGQPVIDVQSVTSSELFGLIKDAYERREELSREIRGRIDPIKQLAVHNAELACGLINGNAAQSTTEQRD